MPNDPIVEEVRKIRGEIESELGDDPKAYYRHLIQLQEQWKERLVTRTPLPPLKTKIAS